MTKVLTKGTRAGGEDTHASWTEHENLIDHNIAFYDLAPIEHQHRDLFHPWFDHDNALILPLQSDVQDFLIGGNTLYIRLPTHPEVDLQGIDHDDEQTTYQYNLLRWLPVGVELRTDREGDLFTVKEEFSGWEWYFDDKFEWEISIPWISDVVSTGSDYTDPRPRLKDGVPITRKAVHFPSTSRPRSGPEVLIEEIAVNNAGEQIACKIQFEDFTSAEAELAPGSIYLIPTHPSIDFTEFVHGILRRVEGIEVEERPGWVDKYSLPGESGIKSDLAKLEQQMGSLEAQIDRGDWFRQLLFAKDEESDEDYSYELEEPVREAFRRVGLDVSGEKNGARDGAIHLDEDIIIIEITGTTSGISPGKVDRLRNHVRDAEDDFDDELTGLLVPNPDCESDPEGRQMNYSNFLDKLEEYGYKVITTFQVYRMLCLYEDGEINTEDIVELLTGEDIIIRFGEDELKIDSGEFKDRIGQFRRRIRDLI